MQLRCSFHSFRHTIQNDLFYQGCDEYIINDLIGHTPAQRSEGQATYSKGSSLKARYDILVKFRCDVTFYTRSGGKRQ